MSLRTEVLAFRIWAFAYPRGWDCTLQELADALDESAARIRAVCQVKKWNSRLRGAGAQYNDLHGVRGAAREDEVATAAMIQLRATNPYGTMEKTE
jgi:hypothetical protein